MIRWLGQNMNINHDVTDQTPNSEERSGMAAKKKVRSGPGRKTAYSILSIPDTARDNTWSLFGIRVGAEIGKIHFGSPQDSPVWLVSTAHDLYPSCQFFQLRLKKPRGGCPEVRSWRAQRDLCPGFQGKSTKGAPGRGARTLQCGPV